MTYWPYPWHPKGTFYDVSTTLLLISFYKGPGKRSLGYRNPRILYLNLVTSFEKLDLKLPKNPLSAGCNACDECSGKRNKSIPLAAQNSAT